MKALSIRQPWAWLILHGGKRIENRSWTTRQRGRILIHAAKGMTRDEYEDGKLILAAANPVVTLPPFEQLQRGGIVGSVEITDCIGRSTSPWFFGPVGFVLNDPKPLPFVPCAGRLGFFDVSDEVLRACGVSQ